MCSRIGDVAGKVWVMLGEKGETDITRVPKALKITAQTAYQAVGWLAREGKINQEERDGKTFIALTPDEMEAFKGLF